MISNARICPRCGGKSNVMRMYDGTGIVTRIRICKNPKCLHQWHTYEINETEVKDETNGTTCIIS